MQKFRVTHTVNEKELTTILKDLIWQAQENSKKLNDEVVRLAPNNDVNTTNKQVYLMLDLLETLSDNITDYGRLMSAYNKYLASQNQLSEENSPSDQ